MKTLETSFTSHGFEFKQIHREADLAIYKKWKPEHETHGFEVIRIKRHNGYTIAGNYCPPAEMYPSNEQWGVLGFTCQTKEDSYKKLDKMKAEAEESEKLITPGTKRGRGRPKGSRNKA